MCERAEGANLVEEEIGVELCGGEIMGAARAVALVVEMSDDAHIAEAMAAGSEECIFDDLHTYRTQQLSV